MKIDSQVKELTEAKEEAARKQPLNIRTLMGNIKYFMEHLDDLLLQQSNPVLRAEFFGVLFDRAPTYNEIKYGTQNPTQLTGINELFKLKNLSYSEMVTLDHSVYKVIISEIIRWNELLSGLIPINIY